MNRKSTSKVYTLVLTGAQVRALRASAKVGIVYSVCENGTHHGAAHRALCALDAVYSKVMEDEKGGVNYVK